MPTVEVCYHSTHCTISYTQMGFGAALSVPGSRVHAGGLVGILLSPLASIRWIWSLVVSPACGIIRFLGLVDLNVWFLALCLGLTSSSGFMG